MTKNKMKKYTIAVGACGPSIMYSKVIKAHSKEEAADKYISETGKEYTEEQREHLISRVREKLSAKETDTLPGVMCDYDMNVLQIGDRVAFICNQPTAEGYRRFSVQEGVISKMSDSSAEIFSEKLNKTFRVMKTSGAYIGNSNSEPRLKKVAKLYDHYDAEKGTLNDALGQSVHTGDVIVYMKDTYQDSCEGFIKGVVQKVSATMAFVEDGKRKTSPKFAVIQRNS